MWEDGFASSGVGIARISDGRSRDATKLVENVLNMCLPHSA